MFQYGCKRTGDVAQLRGAANLRGEIRELTSFFLVGQLHLCDGEMHLGGRSLLDGHIREVQLLFVGRHSKTDIPEVEPRHLVEGLTLDERSPDRVFLQQVQSEVEVSLEVQVLRVEEASFRTTVVAARFVVTRLETDTVEVQHFDAVVLIEMEGTQEDG